MVLKSEIGRKVTARAAPNLPFEWPSGVRSMARFIATIALALVISALLAPRWVPAREAADATYSLGDSVPLDDSELRAITLQVLEKNPLLSSSPGIKSASAQRSVRSTDIASIIYYPHTESAGVKQAFQVRCLRTMPNKLWTCSEVEIRRYLRLESQDFEVRVTGNFGTDVALALIEATRGTAQANATGGSGNPETAIMIHPEGDGYMVAWGSPEGYLELLVKAELRDDGNPAKPDDWQASFWEPKDP